MKAGGLRWIMSERAWLGVFEAQPNGRILCRHELTWRGITPERAAEAIKSLKLSYVVAQADIFPKLQERGETVSETFQRCGVPMRKGSADRLALWSRLRSWLAVRKWADGTEGPGLLLHADCKFLIRTLPTLVESDTEPDDVAETPDEYPAMGVALYVMARPTPWLAPQTTNDPDPLSGAYLWNELRSGGDLKAEKRVGHNRHRERNWV